jgi:putative transposase
VRLLARALRSTRASHPFTTQAIVVLPDHLHTIRTLPHDDADFSLRWELVKKRFTKQLNLDVGSERPKALWQARFWEHLIRDERDLAFHLDYVHYNPVKHGYAECAHDWTYSTFPRYVRDGRYSPDWGDNGHPPDVFPHSVMPSRPRERVRPTGPAANDRRRRPDVRSTAGAVRVAISIRCSSRVAAPRRPREARPAYWPE